MSRDQSDLSKQPFFASTRERRLWIWTLLLVLGIYATLGLAASFAKWLYNQQFSAAVFLACMFMILLAVVTQGLKVRPRGLEIGAVLGIIVVYVLVFLRLTIPERSHLIEYGIVAMFVNEALVERKSQGRYVPFPGILAIVATTIIGTVDEFIQLWLPNRVFDEVDILFNFLAALMAVAATWTVGLARRLGKRVTE